MTFVPQDFCLGPSFASRSDRASRLEANKLGAERAAAANGTFILSLVLFPIALVLSMVRVETAGPEGLAVVTYPYWGYGWVLLWITAGLIAFGISFNLSRAQRRGRAVGGSLMLGIGVPALAYAGLMLWLASSEYNLRCIAIACPPFFQQYFDRIVLWSFWGAAGLALAASGAWILLRRTKRGSIT